MAHGDKLDRVSMNSSLIVGTLLDETGMNAQVTRQLRCWQYRIICDDNIAGAIVEDADDRTVLHRPASQVAHTLTCTLAEEVAALQCRQCCTNLLYFADSWQSLDFVINQVGNVYSDVTTITLSPTILPEITGNFSNLLDLLFQGRTTF
ncbi:Uncharacterised protein [Segatella copri]|nr:Uncharacterised protein [Segatella copri]